MMAAMHVVAFAGGVLGASLLGALDRHVRPVAVVASHASGQPRRPDPLAALWARRRGVPLHYWPTWRDGAGTAALRALAPDLLLSLSYDLVLPAEALRTAPSRHVGQ
jgi:methionyl-tRNA formyltransferase